MNTNRTTNSGNNSNQVLSITEQPLFSPMNISYPPQAKRGESHKWLLLPSVHKLMETSTDAVLSHLSFRKRHIL